LPDGADVPTLGDALAALESSSDVREVLPAEPAIEGAEWELDIELPGPTPGESAGARAWLEPAPEELSLDTLHWRGLTAGDLERARNSSWSLVVSTHLGGHPLRDFHRLVRLLALLAPEAAMIYDLDSLTPRSGHWLREVAAAGTPPSPAALFTIHDVAPESGAAHWLHTHGLGRCGALELDVLGVPADGAGLVGQLVNSVASLFIERGIPEPDEPFLAGEDLELVWLPWEAAMEHVSPDVAGGLEDRDESHAGTRGVLFCAGDRRSPAAYLPILRENPLLYISDMETERMTLLASERLPRLLRLLARFGSSEGWLFLVKLGYPVDDAESPSDREHLWFEVHAYEGGEVDATLLNEPYRIAALSEGARARHSLDRLSDWSILCERGRFDANTIAELERSLLDAPGAH
jgi:uncharacterized protein YegJ (DUF2314 family)